jgi:ankyrin repeat protein
MLLQASRIGHEGIVHILLEWGVDINLTDGYHRTAMSWASKEGQDSVVKLLLQAEGIDINLKDGICGQNALSLASENRHDSVVKLLLQAEGIDINSKDKRDQTALSWAFEKGHDSTAQLLIIAGAIDRRETSMLANPVQLDKQIADQTAE